jgi:hypothetical protein
MTTRTTLRTLGCGLTLALTVGLATAAPRPARPAPSQASTLTVQEQYCQQIGLLTMQAAEARDAGVPLLRLLQAVRQPPHTGTPAMQTALEGILRVAYTHRELSPPQMRQQAELVCLDKITPTEAAPNNARLRY